ncbi:hypothetical protein OH76DRAFT_1407427 [Lentinus brumalis]|uniref:Integrase zinc-binding domain-containing protein n=1 Tax=Lentinus brumalis TaxID=2498619 RepID=A0A371D0L5_9APHY|nr:hypothetical protein OH76DRAFT_1407427 [Polyporus brumalis]
MPAQTNRRTTEEAGKGKARAAEPYPPSRQFSNTSAVTDWHAEQAQGMSLLRPPLAHKSSSSSSSGSSRSQRSMRLDLGVPTREEFAALEEQYLESLDYRKKKKALISQAMFDKIWLALHCPDDVSIETPQFRWWVRKMFALVDPSQLADDVLPALEARPSWKKAQGLQDGYFAGLASAELAVVHNGKRVAVREQIYDILCICHQRVKHSGRDKTSAEIRKTFNWIPKDLVSLFVKNCPTCMHKKTGAFEEYPVEEQVAPADVFPVANLTASPVLCDSGIANVMARYLSMPTNNVIMASRSGLAYSSSACSLAPSDCGPLPPVPMLAYPEYPPGPGPAAHSAGDHYTSQGNLSSHASSWQVYPSHSGCHITPSNSAWHLGPQDVAYMPPASQNNFLQLPSAHVDGGPPHTGVFHGHPAKVTLPSFSEMFAGGLTVDDHDPCRARARQPLQALPHNSGTGFGGTASLQVPPPDARLASISPSSSMHYAPVGSSHAGMVPIDPALLYYDGMRMLALAAEAREFQRFADENARM